MKNATIIPVFLVIFSITSVLSIYAQNPLGNKNIHSRKELVNLQYKSVSQNTNSHLEDESDGETFNININGESGIELSSSVMEEETKSFYSKDVLLDEGFETWPPADWNYYEMGVSSPGWQQSNYQPHTGTYSALHGYFSGGVHDNWMVTPQLTIDQTYNLEFWDKLTSYNYYEYSGVHISTSSGDPSSGDFVEIYNAGNATANVWVEHVFDLTPYIGEDIYIAFKYSGNNAHRWYVDDVTVIPLTYTDGGITAIINPPVGITTTGGSIEDVLIELTNFGTDIIENADIDWMVNNVSQPTFTATNLSLSEGGFVELNIGQYDFSQYMDYEISVTCNIVNDQNIANDNLTDTYTVDDLGDAGVTGITPNGQSGAAFQQDVSVIIKNFGIQILESVEVEWDVNDVPQIPFVASNLGLAPGTSIERTIGQYDFSSPDYYEIFAGTNLPADYAPANDTMSVLFSSALLRESFEGPHDDFWPPDHWLSLNASPLTDWPYDGEYMGHILSGAGEFGETDGWLATPLLDINSGDFINFQLQFDLASGGGFSINWMDGQTGELNFIQSITVTPGDWYEQNIDISSAAGLNRIVFKVHSDSYAETFLDYVKCTAPTYTFDSDLEVLRFEHNWTPATNEPDAIMCKVRNYTAYNVADGSYTVKLLEEPGIELGSITGTALSPMEVKEFQFDFTFTDEEQHNLYIEVEYANEMNPGDNVSNVVSVYPVPGTTEFVEIGNAELGNLNIPFDTFGTEGLGQDDFTQIIYHFDEIGTMGYLYGLKFHYFLYGLIYGQELPLTVWIGETFNDDLSNGWEPYENLTMVFDSLVITHNYENEMFIPFDQPYLFTGGNLVIQIIQHDPSFPASWTNFYTTNTPGEIRTAKSPDWYELDPENPPSFEWETQHWEQLPDATFILNPFENLAEVSGTVYNENTEPIENVFIELEGTAVNTYTNDLGTYSFPTIPFEEWTFKASYLGYEDNFQTITVDETNEILDFNMIPKPLVTLNGLIEGSDQPGVGLENVSIEISGYNIYETLTGSNGSFSIENVYGNADYSINVSTFGYESFSTTFSVSDENIDFGTIILQERVISAYNVLAQENPDEVIAEIYWPDPLSGMEDTLQYDLGDQAYGLANEPMENVWLGNLMPNNEIITITSVTVYFINNPQTSGEVALDIFDVDENLLVSSETFYTQNDAFLTIDFPNLTYDGDLYIMLHWKDNPATTHMLGIDFTPNISNYCYIHYPNQGFELLSDFLGTSPGVALIRANILKAAEEKSNSDNKAVLSYNIYRGEHDDFYNISNWELINSSPITELEYLDEDWLYTEPNDYRYAVEAVYVEGVAEFTYTNVISIDFVSPTEPLVEVISSANGTALFSWVSPEHNVESYSIYLDDMNNPVATGITDVEYTFNGVPYGSHIAGVQAVYNTGESGILTTEFDVITNISSNLEDEIALYPNPAKDFIQIENAVGFDVVIYDLTGKVQMQFTCGSIVTTIDISELQSGIYLTQLKKDDVLLNKKINISR